MSRKLIIVALALCLLVGGIALFQSSQTTEPTGNAIRMAALGLMLLDSDEGVSVLAVRDGSPADRAGIEPGDVLLQADGSTVTDVLQLEELLAQAEQQMCIELRRSQEELVTLRLSVQ